MPPNCRNGPSCWYKPRCHFNHPEGQDGQTDDNGQEKSCRGLHDGTAQREKNEGVSDTAVFPYSEEGLDACQKFVDFISNMPVSVTLKVFSLVETRDLLKAAQTCHIWRFLAEDDVMWRGICKQAGLLDCLSLTPADHTVLAHRNKMNSSLQESLSRLGKSSCSFEYSLWKAAYLRDKRIDWNFRHCTGNRKVLKSHKGGGVGRIEVFNNKIASDGYGYAVNVWCVFSGKCLRTLIGHTQYVISIQMDENFIITGSWDKSIKVWSFYSDECLHTLEGHTGPVSCMELNEGTLVSGSHDSTLRLWDVQARKCLTTMTGHQGKVRSVHYKGNQVVSRGEDNKVKIWDPRSGECLRILDHSGIINVVKFDGVHVITGSLDRSVKVWNVETGARKYTFAGYVPGDRASKENLELHNNTLKNLELHNNILVYKSMNNSIKIFNILTGTFLQKLVNPDWDRCFEESNDIEDIQFNEKYVVAKTDGWGGVVKLWDIKTGEYISECIVLNWLERIPTIRMTEAKIVCTYLCKGSDYTKRNDTEIHIFDWDF